MCWKQRKCFSLEMSTTGASGANHWILSVHNGYNKKAMNFLVADILICGWQRDINNFKLLFIWRTSFLHKKCKSLSYRVNYYGTQNNIQFETREWKFARNMKENNVTNEKLFIS